MRNVSFKADPEIWKEVKRSAGKAGYLLAPYVNSLLKLGLKAKEDMKND